MVGSVGSGMDGSSSDSPIAGKAGNGISSSNPGIEMLGITGNGIAGRSSDRLNDGSAGNGMSNSNPGMAILGITGNGIGGSSSDSPGNGSCGIVSEQLLRAIKHAWGWDWCHWSPAKKRRDWCLAAQHNVSRYRHRAA